MASSDVWADYEQIRHGVRQNTVDRLKQIIAGFNEECGTNLVKTGKKQDIIERIHLVMDQWRAGGIESTWVKAKNILSRVRSNGHYVSSRNSAAPVPTGLPQQVGGYHNTTYVSTSTKTAPYSALNGATSTSTLRYDPYAPPRKATLPATGAHASSSTASRSPTIRFKDSPFFTIDQQVSAVIECPESNSAMDRRQQTLTFTLTNDQINKLKQPSSNYQLRLFCTSSTFHNSATPAAFRNTLAPCPIEFPPTCEVRINGTLLTANVKGLKKKPGTAPPPDLGKCVRWNSTQNRLEMVYVNSTQPTQPKKFYLVVMLVATTTVDRLVENLKANSRHSAHEIRQIMIESAQVDDDIQSGPQKMSLKCPLSYMRVGTPCRSSKCVHSQCFDATSWFQMMEQTTTYLCPTCDRSLEPKDLIIDGYFDEILRSTPESVEDVIVEADGEWHTSDNKFASALWKATHAVIAKPASPSKPPPVARPPPAEDKGKGRSAEVVVLSDTEDEDEGFVKRELSPSNSRSLDSIPYTPAPHNPGPSQLAGEVIDLTLSDEDEDEPAPVPPPPRAYKRTADSADLPDYHSADPWKKSRPSVDPQSSPHLPPMFHGSNGSTAREPNRNLVPLAVLSAQSQAPRPPLPNNPYNNSLNRQSLTDSRQLPPIDSYRSSGTPRW
ncbi:hypothetical protein FA13DRAFT_1762980 [Coprinellus micaceus]|uniref:Zf-MIZ-domain-containing protein n=1 Tax=Coprinellus micaceus TaxID=71717 RepID=A0A4Y7TLZ8_COPMI|nr:hypothetical protein FA13DRAFT_1762980 [Coprinellus micaceus]